MLELEGKTAFVFGVASEDSIAWAICQKLASAATNSRFLSTRCGQ